MPHIFGKDKGYDFSSDLLRQERKDQKYAQALAIGTPFNVLLQLMNAGSEEEENRILADVKAGKYK